MITFNSPGIGVTIYAHTDGEFDRERAEKDLTPGQLFGLDTESTSLTDKGVFDPDYRLRLVQISTDSVAHVFDMEDWNQRNYAYEVLANLDNSFCAHTNIDTLAVWVTLDMDISLRLIDTRMLATMAQPDDREGGNDLKTLVSRHLGPWLKQAQVALGSKEESFDWSGVSKTDDAYLIYAGLDAIGCRRLVPILVELTEAPPSLLKIEMWADAQAAKWKMRGYRIDEEAHKKLWKESAEHCEKHSAAFGEIAYEMILKCPKRNPHYVQKPISPRSGKKVSAFLREHGANFLGYPLTDKGKELAEAGELTYEMEVSGEYASLSKKYGKLLEAMQLDSVGREALSHLLEFKSREYTVTKMKEVEKVMADGRVHPTLRTIGAVTGRMSSSGPNFQNFGKKSVEMREIVIPDPGMVFIAADFDQIELRVVAALANVVSMIKVILDGGDLHSLTAVLAQCTRDIAKIVAFLIVYGGGAKALNEQTGIPLNDCKTIIANYRSGYPEIDAYSKYCAEFEEEIRPISGRKIPVGKTKDGFPRTYANVNYDVQGGARELAMAAWWRYQHDPERKGEAAMIIHDELVAMVPIEYWEEELKRLEKAMTFDFMGVPITAGGALMADETGRACWTSVDQAEKYAEIRKENGVGISAAA